MVDHVVRRSLWNGLRRSCGTADNPPLSLDEYEARNAASFAAFAAEVAPQPLLSRWRADPQNPLLMLLLAPLVAPWRLAYLLHAGKLSPFELGLGQILDSLAKRNRT